MKKKAASPESRTFAKTEGLGPLLAEVRCPIQSARHAAASTATNL